MQQGNVKLVGGTGGGASSTTTFLASAALDLLHGTTNSGSGGGGSATAGSASDLGNGTPRVVVVSNRERTRAVDEEEQWDQLIRVENNSGSYGLTTANSNDIDPAAMDPALYNSNNANHLANSGKRLSSLSTVVAARWTKHHSSLQRIGTKLSKWARSIQKYSCTSAESTSGGGSPYGGGGGVHLDRYVHPPGHDDKRATTKFVPPHVVKAPIAVPAQTQAPISSSGHPMHSGAATAAVLDHSASSATKPNPVQTRSLSAASSEYDVRMLS
jgi:hypothetical protein